MNNPYAAPDTVLSHAPVLGDVLNTLSIQTAKGPVVFSRSEAAVTVSGAGNETTFAGPQFVKQIILLFWNTKQINFKPLKLTAQVSDEDFAKVLDFYGREEFQRHDLRQARILELFFGVLLVALGGWGLAHPGERVIYDAAVLLLGSLGVISFAMSFSSRHVVHYALRAATNLGFTVLTAINIVLGGSAWLAIIAVFCLLSFWNYWTKFRYFSR